MFVSQLVRIVAGSTLNIRLLLQTPELVPISLKDCVDGGRVHEMISPCLLLKSEDGTTEIELQGQWQLGVVGSFCTCSFQLFKAGRYSAGV